MVVCVLRLSRIGALWLRSHNYFFTFTPRNAVILTTCILCLSLRLHDSIDLNFGQRSILKFGQHLGLRLALIDLFLFRLLVTLSETSTTENHIIAIISSHSLYVFASHREMFAVNLLTLSRCLFRF